MSTLQSLKKRCVIWFTGSRKQLTRVQIRFPWWRARTRKRRLVVERAEADGLARAKVLRILDELGQA